MVARRSGPAIQVDGMKELLAALREIDKAAMDMKDANQAAGQLIVDEAKMIVPKRSGRLERTIRANRAAGAATVRAGTSGVPYAGPIHFGWPSRPNPAKGWRGGPIQPNPFLYDAVDHRRDEVVEAYEKYIDGILRKNDLI